jgi:hypothetical protein
MEDRKATGQNIESYCSNCKQGTDHTIMVMDGETVAKVRCKTCGRTHKFRSPAEGAVTRKPRKKRTAGEEATAEMVWEAGLAEAKGKAREYSMDARYRIGDIVDHHRFGKGIVLKVYYNKCGMLFKDGEKLMVSTNQ